jgi:hypothetical protein
MREPNSTPIVTSWSSENSFTVILLINEDFPTPEDPMMISLKRKSYLVTDEGACD